MKKLVELPMCAHYTTTGYPNFKPKCTEGLFASLKCHEKRKDCPEYKPSLTGERE